MESQNHKERVSDADIQYPTRQQLEYLHRFTSLDYGIDKLDSHMREITNAQIRTSNNVERLVNSINATKGSTRPKRKQRNINPGANDPVQLGECDGMLMLDDQEETNGGNTYTQSTNATNATNDSRIEAVNNLFSSPQPNARQPNIQDVFAKAVRDNFFSFNTEFDAQELKELKAGKPSQKLKDKIATKFPHNLKDETRRKYTNHVMKFLSRYVGYPYVDERTVSKALEAIVNSKDSCHMSIAAVKGYFMKM